jgi:hypothetical protein
MKCLLCGKEIKNKYKKHKCITIKGEYKNE